MTVKTVVKGADPEVVKVGLTDGSFLLFRASYLNPGVMRPSLGLELSEELTAEYRCAADAYAAELAALRLISLREHSRFLLSIKLRRRECSQSSIAVVLDRLQNIGLVNDERFALMWVESRVASKRECRAKLFGGLLSRGVSRDIADRVLGLAVDEHSEIERAKKLIEKLKRGASKSDEAIVKKLRASGYSEKTIRLALRREEE
jgi:regulatory protein